MSSSSSSSSSSFRLLKYGCNPQQKVASIEAADASKGMPFEVRNGNPGYINLLDALNAWQLVSELSSSLGMPAAASFKHVSPAGAAVGVALTPALRAMYGIADDEELPPLAVAYLRARNADPKSSFGDFAALSHTVDEATARLLKREVSDGIIAPGFEPAALELLKSKKGGNFIVLEAKADFVAPDSESRDIFGVRFSQQRNATIIGKEHLTKVVSACKELPVEAQRDLIVASIACKYTQSNSVVYAHGGQVIGVGAGQQSRVDCVKLAGSKASNWFLRSHPKVLALPFRDGLKRVERTNATMSYIDGDFTDAEFKAWAANFVTEPELLTFEDKKQFVATMEGVSLSSDAFFPFRDNIDQASKRGVKYIAQPGGSVQDEGVTRAGDEYNMVMVHTGVRLFHH